MSIPTVAYFDDLPTVSTPPVDTQYWVTNGSGTGPGVRTPAGLYQRINTTGVLAADWQYWGNTDPYGSVTLASLGAASSAKFIAGSGALTGPAFPLTIGTAAGHAATDFAPSSGIALTALATQANNTILGNISGGVAVPSALTGANVRTIIGMATTDTPTFAGLTLTNLAALTTPAESWVGPSATAGIYFKGGFAGRNTTSPSAAFDIQDTLASAISTGSGVLRVQNNSTTVADMATILFISTGDNQARRAVIGAGEDGTVTNAGYLSFIIRNAAGTFAEGVRLCNSGFGVGTSLPVSALDVRRSGPTTLRLQNDEALYDTSQQTCIDFYGRTYSGTPTDRQMRASIRAIAQADGFNRGNLVLYSNGDTPSTPIEGLRITWEQKVIIASSLTTGAPAGGTAKPIKFGAIITATSALDVTRYVQAEIDGVACKLALIS